jgi:hypothetical protein
LFGNTSAQGCLWGVKKVFLPHLIITDGEWAPFHLEPDMLVGFGKYTHQGMQNWKSVTDFPASMAVHSSPPGAQPHLQSHPVLIACPAAICFSQDGPLVPSWVQELGLFSELCASHHARRLRTECLQVNYLLGPSSWGSAYALARLASQGPEHVVAGT